jgi:UDP-N-acetylmuramoylalanine--D-glutamate ligase
MSQRLTILGAGESGVGAARLAMQKGWQVFLSDSGKLKEPHRMALVALKVDFEEGTHTLERILQSDLVVKSPGIPDKAEVIKELHKAGIPVISEIEFAWRYNKAKIIAITGSNGKTTTTLLTHHILKKAGINVGLAGNVGNSFAGALCEPDEKDWYVLELSSFQLDGIDKFKADIAILTNITPDHLDRYGYSIEAYADSKFRITLNQTPDDYFIYCADDEMIDTGIAKHKPLGQKLPFSLTKQIEEGATIINENLTINLKIKPLPCQYTNSHFRVSTTLTTQWLPESLPECSKLEKNWFERASAIFKTSNTVWSMSPVCTESRLSTILKLPM